MLPKIAFIVWNSFQLLHFKPLLKAIPTALLIVERRKKSKEIERALFNGISNNIAYIDHNKIFQKIDGHFDVLVTQTVFEQLHLFRKTKVAMLQYGYAKEPHNYGTWRSLADVNLVYGQYAADRIGYFSPVEVTGCPKYDEYHSTHFLHAAQEKYRKSIDYTKPTVVYAPSWGNLSSFNDYISGIEKLSQHYNVLVKLHHNTVFFSKVHQDYHHQYPHLHFYYENDDLLSLIAISDLVISDFSGAIFEAIFCKKPVVLLSNSAKNDEKLDKYSLEIANRKELGYEVFSPKDLLQTVNKAMIEKKLVHQNLYHQLFMDTTNATQNVIDSLQRLAKGSYALSQQQLYVRQTEIRLQEEIQKNQASKKPLHNLKQISKKIIRRKKK